MPHTAYGFPVQEEFDHDILSRPFRHRDGFLELDGRARFNDMPIVRSDDFGHLLGMNVKVGLTADLLTLHLMAALILPVY
jgi:hypothetical protein